ncbi:DUF3572 domain-containing protein [Aureimonas sp. AU40]|uniref:DUF3572 domain-containing protein n=1 Tax=Aureimonas sp. AU40 TaxID=1637747 RepID=UPI000785E69D|nr:DUF3572 domain-containing protein [Aureimonas sp. AU40]
MIRGGTRAIGSGKDAETIGIDALTFLAGDNERLNRFLDLSGLSIEQLRLEATKPAFFVGLLDFILAHEPTLMAFAGAAGLDPAEVGLARKRLANGSDPAP